MTITTTGAADTIVSAQTNIVINAAPPTSYTVKDEGQGKITAVDAGGAFIMIGTKKIVWSPATQIIVNTPNGELHAIDNSVKVGMRAQWKGLRNKDTNTVLATKLEIN